MKGTAKDLLKAGVTNLGTSYDFNKLRKGLDTVQHKNGGGGFTFANNTRSSLNYLHSSKQRSTHEQLQRQGNSGSANAINGNNQRSSHDKLEGSNYAPQYQTADAKLDEKTKA